MTQETSQADGFTAHDMADQGAKQFAAGARSGAQPEPVAWELFNRDGTSRFTNIRAAAEEWERDYGKPVRPLYERAWGGAQPVGMTDEQIKAAYIKHFGSDKGWLGQPGSFFTEGIKCRCALTTENNFSVTTKGEEA